MTQFGKKPSGLTLAPDARMVQRTLTPQAPAANVPDHVREQWEGKLSKRS